jgi:uncharacterized membrane protein
MIGIGLLLSAFLLLLLPLLFAELLAASLFRLHLAPDTALLLLLAIMLGGLINIPIRRLSRGMEVMVDPFAVYGLAGRIPLLRRVRRDTIIAVNLGGCLIPTGLALYEAMNLDPASLLAVSIAAPLNILVCYLLARPLAGIGITLPALVPAFTAALAAMLLAPTGAAPVAYIAGVLGPLVGADLLHLRDIRRIATGVASIGGAGTFDSIVLSGLVAAYLA